MYCYLNIEVPVGGDWKNFEECGRKDLEQIVSRNGMLMTLLVKTGIGVSYTLQQTEQKLYLVLWNTEFVSLFANKLRGFLLFCFLT